MTHMPTLTGYNIVNLEDLLQTIGEDDTKNILSSFSCPQNEDLEHFIKFKALEFSKQRISATYLIFMSYRSAVVMAAYFTIAHKAMLFDLGKIGCSNSLKKKINKHATFDKETKKSVVQAILIGQLGKNFTKGYNKLIPGSDLLEICLDKIREIQLAIGGALVIVECEDNENLNKFYDSKGFVTVDQRKLDGDETRIKGQYLIRKMMYLKSKIPDNRF